MKEDVKQMITFQLDILKKTMKDNNVVFSIQVNEENRDKSAIGFLDLNCLKNGIYEGFTISLDEINKGLIHR